MISREKIRELVTLYRDAVHTYSHMVLRNVENTGVSHSQHQTLQYIYMNSGCSQKDIANAQHISSAAAAVNLQRMERDGLISRVTDSVDNRRNVLTLTQKGLDLASGSTKLFEAFEELTVRGISDHEADILYKTMEKLLRNMQRVEANPNLVLQYVKEKEEKETTEE